MNPLKFQVGTSLDREVLIQGLFDLNYKKEEHVLKPGEFSERGSLVDIYPVGYRNPVRLVFELDRLQAIKDFSPISGEIQGAFQEVTLLSLTEKEERKLSRIAAYFLDRTEPPEPGDFVVHSQFGVAHYLGVREISVSGKSSKRHTLEFAGGQILYVENKDESFISRYIGVDRRKPKLSKLHGKEWKRIQAQTQLAIENVAHEMLRLQAERDVKKGHAFSREAEWQKKFEDEFPYEETEDQTRAWAETRRDMETPKPMDRLICGDVGYGKTEIAFRAAFKAVMDGKQAAFLVPTTILAEQHYLTFKERVKNFPASVDVLSRFQTPHHQKQVVARLKEGSCDVVIGTHRLLSKDVGFKDLGLVIIDEEQRFGVRHKERLKEYRRLVDVLTLTATPIPRTLYSSLMGVRNMSSIHTPPKARKAIHTEVLRHDPGKIREIFLREKARGGQIYYVHNRVQSIERIATQLAKILPEISFCVAHGQMPAAGLEKVMDSFLRHHYDCLISTNIIESGLDIPNVNTILVNRADQFGLADLYQLRGRVGRSDKQAYAYFLLPRNFVLTEDADRRLEALTRFTDLGAGYRLALEDLEMRGAGNLLGHEQTGFIYQVGFDLYCKMLKETIRKIQSRR